MELNEKTLKRFDELLSEGTAMLATAYSNYNLTTVGLGIMCVDRQKAEQWAVAEELSIKTEAETSLSVGYYGLLLLFRIEIDCNNTANDLSTLPVAKVAAYKTTYDNEPKEILLHYCVFNSDGNFKLQNGSWLTSSKDFATRFLDQVFNEALSKGMQLRP